MKGGIASAGKRFCEMDRKCCHKDERKSGMKRDERKKGKDVKDKRKMFKRTTVVMAVAVLMVVGGATAYFTATDDVTNRWTVGNVDIELQEPQYDASEGERTDIVPNKDLAKDPQIQNTGFNDAFVFLKVTVPKADVIVAAQDGTQGAKQVQELFDYRINSAWVLVASSEGTTANTYIYAYGNPASCTVLAPDEVTSVLFDSGTIKFKNVIEGQGLENSTLEMPVEAFGIQTTDITDNDVTAPKAVWAVLNNQLTSGS